MEKFPRETHTGHFFAIDKTDEDQFKEPAKKLNLKIKNNENFQRTSKAGGKVLSIITLKY